MGPIMTFSYMPMKYFYHNYLPFLSMSSFSSSSHWLAFLFPSNLPSSFTSFIVCMWTNELIRLTYKSTGEVSLETWATYPWLCTEDVSLLPQQILTDYESSERGGASWVPPLSMTEFSQVPSYAGLAQVITAAKSSRVWQPSPSYRTASHTTLSLPPALPFYLPHSVLPSEPLTLW